MTLEEKALLAWSKFLDERPLTVRYHTDNKESKYLFIIAYMTGAEESAKKVLPIDK